VSSLTNLGSSSGQQTRGLKIHRCPCVGIVGMVNPATPILHKLLTMKVDVTHAHSYIFFTSNQAALARRISRRPLVLHLHGGVDFSAVGDKASSYLSMMKRLYDPTLGKWTVRTADVVGSVSKRDLNLARDLWNVDASRLCWLPNAVNSEVFYQSQSGEDLNVVFIGRLETWKGIQVFLDVAEAICKERDDVDFLVVGDGNLRNHVESQCKQSCGNKIKVLGQVSNEEIATILSGASVLVLPSYVEGLPTVCLEALASEVPVVASDVGGVSEVVIDGETGYLFPPGDVKECFEKIMRLLVDERLRTRMGRKGRRLVNRFYTWTKVVNKIEGIYRSIAN